MRWHVWGPEESSMESFSAPLWTQRWFQLFHQLHCFMKYILSHCVSWTMLVLRWRKSYILSRSQCRKWRTPCCVYLDVLRSWETWFSPAPSLLIILYYIYIQKISLILYIYIYIIFLLVINPLYLPYYISVSDLHATTQR